MTDRVSPGILESVIQVINIDGEFKMTSNSRLALLKATVGGSLGLQEDSTIPENHKSSEVTLTEPNRRYQELKKSLKPFKHRNRK